MALEGDAALEGAIRWADQPLVKMAEWGLVVLLTLHLSFGLRVLVLEFMPWHDSRKAMIGLVAAASLAAGLLFLFNLG